MFGGWGGGWVGGWMKGGGAVGSPRHTQRLLADLEAEGLVGDDADGHTHALGARLGLAVRHLGVWISG